MVHRCANALDGAIAGARRRAFVGSKHQEMPSACPSMLHVTQPQRHRRKIDREAGCLEEILTGVSDTALASDDADAL